MLFLDYTKTVGKLVCAASRSLTIQRPSGSWFALLAVLQLYFSIIHHGFGKLCMILRRYSLSIRCKFKEPRKLNVRRAIF